MKNLLGLVSLVLTLAGYAPYIFSIVQKKTKPHFFSWVIWGTVASIIYCAQDSAQAGPGAWAMGMTAISCFLIAILACFYGEKNITKLDWLCFIGALTAIPVWYVTQEPLPAVLWVMVIDAGAYYPTFRKSYHKPYEENLAVYISTVMKFSFALLALESYSLTTALSPVFIMMVETGFIAMVLLRRQKLTNPYTFRTS